MTDADRVELEVLPPAECDRLLRSGHLGRVAVVLDDQPLVLPVNYACDGHSVVFCTGAGSLLDRVAGVGRVAFQIDSADPQYHQGWSVLVLGRMEVLTDEAELARIASLPVRAWVTWSRRRWVRIVPSSVSGRRVRRS